MYFKGKEGCPAGGLLCKSKTDFHKAKQVHSVCRSRRLCRLAGSSAFPETKANPYALPNTFVGADAHIGPAELHRFYENLRRIRNCLTGRCGHRPLQSKEGAYEFAAKLQPAVVFRAGGQSRPPLQASWKRCIIKHSLLLLFYRIISSSASGEISSVMPKRSMA